MQRPSAVCVDDEQLLRMAARTVPADELEPLHAHLDECTTCMDALLAIVQASRPAAPAPATLGETQLGRFALRSLLGSGNMGTVYTAWDPQLDREVAIKVLRAGRADERDAARLLREAKAMARVRHPNVVTVFEVGQDADVIFIAMERITGTTLRAAITNEPPPQAVRLAWLAQIAQALAAVHAAGFIHRDLKPDNVFVEGDRAVVGDFGLAATFDVAPPAERGSAPVIATRVAGTPAYMAPEQLHGESLDARADVFAFGVTAWEVLTGARPFAGQTAAALDEAIRIGPRKSPAFAALPPAIARLLERCVHGDRAERPASMDEIVATLAAVATPAQRRSRRGLVLGASALVLVLGATIAVLATRGSDTAVAATSACDPYAPAVWDTLSDRWLARSTHLAPVVRQGIVATMKERSTAWSTLAVDTCARDVFAQTAWTSCRARVEAAERAVLELAVERRWPDDLPLVRVFEALDPPSVCASKEAAEDAAATARLSEDARAAVASGLALLVRARALARLDATADVDRALADARGAASRAAPSLLDAELQLAQVELRPPDAPKDELVALQAAAAQAERNGRAALIARAWLALAERAQALDLDAATLASAMSQADWAIARLADPPRLRVQWMLVKATITWSSGDHPTARREFGEAQVLAGKDPFLAGARREAVASIATIAGDDLAAAAIYREFLAAPELMGDASVRERITLINSLVEALYRLGQLDEAQRLSDEALALGRNSLPADDPTQITSVVIAASIIFERGDATRALETLASAEQATHRALGDDHIIMSHIHMRTAQVLFHTGRIAEGITAARASIQISDARVGRRSEVSVIARSYLGEALYAAGDIPGSLEISAEADADARALYGADHPMWAQGAPAYARSLTAAGRTDEARALLEAALPVLVRAEFDPGMTSQLQFELAKLLAQREPARARELATSALSGASANERATITAWLQAQRR